MKRKERRRKFHDLLLNMLYAPPSPPIHQEEFDDQTLKLAREISDSDHHHINTDELEGEEGRSLSTSSEENDELGSQKLTRAQRKRLRKKKLKEAAFHRRQIIGPQLPITDDQVNREDGNVTEYQQPQGVRQNAVVGPEKGSDHNHGETTSCTKVKQRRMSKKKGKTTHTHYSPEDPCPGNQNETVP